VLILGLDLETSGLDPKVDRIIEVGAVLFDWDTQKPMQMISELVDPLMDLSIDEFTLTGEIIEHTGITMEMLETFGSDERDVLRMIEQMAEKADYRMGHFCNDFDALFLQEAYARTGITEPALDWLDTSIDVRYPEKIKTRNLRHLAAEHGFLNPFPHRAVFDVLTMFKVAGCYNLEDIIARAKEPTVYVQALVKFEVNHLAKDRGYRWNPAKKIWWKQFKVSDFEAERQDYGFATQFLTEAPE
jgi:DNA polymerase-3 subunit epsilon